MMAAHVSRQAGGLTVNFRKIFSIDAAATGTGCLAGLVLSFAANPIHAADLTVIRQNAQEFICTFESDCRPGAASSDAGPIIPPEPSSDPRLFASSFPAKAGTPGAGATVYLYRVDVATTNKASECLSGVVLNFGPLADMPPVNGNTAQVFVLTSGDAAGIVPIKSAEQDGDFIQLNFDGGLCPGTSSLLFALPSKHPPTTSGATIFGYAYPPVTTARVTTPKYSTATPSNTGVNPE
jgi:hypothetical protein